MMRIGLLRDQQPFAEFVNNRWRVWYIYNTDVTKGTYYELSYDGICDRVTVCNGDVVRIDRVASPPTGPVYEEQASEFQWQRAYEL
jgi:hypothetical protein